MAIVKQETNSGTLLAGYMCANSARLWCQQHLAAK